MYVCVPTLTVYETMIASTVRYILHNYENTVISGIFYCHLKIKQKEIYGKNSLENLHSSVDQENIKEFNSKKSTISDTKAAKFSFSKITQTFCYWKFAETFITLNSTSKNNHQKEIPN